MVDRPHTNSLAFYWLLSIALGWIIKKPRGAARLYAYRTSSGNTIELTHFLHRPVRLYMEQLNFVFSQEQHFVRMPMRERYDLMETIESATIAIGVTTSWVQARMVVITGYNRLKV